MNQTSGGMPSPGMPPVLPPQKKTSVWWLAIFALAAVLVAAAWYYYTYVPSFGLSPIVSTTPGQADAATSRLMQQGTSDDPAAIEADLRATDLSGLDQELSDIDTQLGF